MENEQVDERIYFTPDQLKSFANRMRAEGARNRKEIGMPGAFYASREDREQKMEQAQVLFKFFAAAKRDDQATIEGLEKEYPDWFGIEKAAGDPFATDDNDRGGYAVPEFWENEVVSLQETYGFYERLAMPVPMSGKKVNVPTDAGGTITVSHPAEGAAGTATDANGFFGKEQAVAAFMDAAFIETEEFMEDALPATMTFIAKRVAQALAKETDRIGFNGLVSNSDPFDGVINKSGITVVYQGGSNGSGKTAFSHASWKDVVNLMNSLGPTAQQGAYLFGTQSYANYLQQETDSTGRPIFTNNVPMPLQPQGIYGFQTQYGPPMLVLPVGVMPTSAAGAVALLYGNLAEWAYYARRSALKVQIFDQYYKGALDGRKRATVFKQRYATGILQASGFGVLKTSAS